MTPLSNKPARRIAIVIEMQYALPWHQDCYQGIMHYGHEHGWRCTLDLSAAGVHGDLTRTDYHGVIGRIPKGVAERVAGLGLPMVHLTRYVDPNDTARFEDQYGVFTDRPAGTRRGVEHLVESGYPRIGVVIEEGFEQERTLDAAKASCAEQGAAWVEPFIWPDESKHDYEAHAHLMQSFAAYLTALDKPVGLMVNNSAIARLLAHLCEELGMGVPEEVGIVTRMGAEIMLTSGTPTISSISYDYFKQGYQAAAMLDRLMSGQRMYPAQQWLGPAEVVVRDSTDVFLCEDELVAQAMRHIAAHIREDLNVARLAEAVGVNRSTLYRRFEEALGKPPQDEISRLRTDYLKRLLRETEMPIMEIAHSCGFSASSQFTRFFKRAAGVTPSAYRAARMQQQPS